MIVRRATVDDVPELLRLGELMRRESLEPFPEVDPSYTRKIAELTFDRPDYCVFVLEDGGLTGMLTATVGGYVFSPERYATTDLLFIQPDRRSFGAFKSLMRAYVLWADDNGLRDKRIGVSTNKNISPLMAAFGFKEIGMNYRRIA